MKSSHFCRGIYWWVALGGGISWQIKIIRGLCFFFFLIFLSVTYNRATTGSNSDRRTLFYCLFLLIDGVIVIYKLPIIISFLYFYSYQIQMSCFSRGNYQFDFITCHKMISMGLSLKRTQPDVECSCSCPLDM